MTRSLYHIICSVFCVSACVLAPTFPRFHFSDRIKFDAIFRAVFAIFSIYGPFLTILSAYFLILLGNFGRSSNVVLGVCELSFPFGFQPNFRFFPVVSTNSGNILAGALHASPPINLFVGFR